jgi:hypothetical protein
MTPEEIDSFVMSGRSALTVFASGQEALERYGESFEARGGAAVFGEDALEIVTLSNDLIAFMTPARAAIVARLRTDI